MNDQHKAWLELYIESGDARKATKAIYKDVQGKSIATKTSYLKSTLANEIDEHAREQYKKETPLMMNVIKDLALNGKQEAVRGKMADLWLSRAGHDAAQVIQLEDNATHEQLVERLKIAMSTLPKDLVSSVLPPELITLMDDDNGQSQSKH